VEIRLGEEVKGILVDELQRGRGRAKGVLIGEDLHKCDLVACNGDPPFVHKNLLIRENHSLPRDEKYLPFSGRRWTARRINKLKYSMGLFVLYFGTTNQYPNIAHHTIILGEKYQQLLKEMFDQKNLEMSDLSIYLHRPTATDPSMAPAGCDCWYALVPVPNLLGGQNWKELGPMYRDVVVDYLDRVAIPGLKACIVEDFYVTPDYFAGNLNTMHGTGFSIQPTFDQSAYFRFHNRSEDIEGLYFVGAGTHPGAGMPGVLCSAKVLERVLPAKRIVKNEG